MRSRPIQLLMCCEQTEGQIKRKLSTPASHRLTHNLLTIFSVTKQRSTEDPTHSHSNLRTTVTWGWTISDKSRMSDMMNADLFIYIPLLLVSKRCQQSVAISPNASSSFACLSSFNFHALFTQVFIVSADFSVNIYSISMFFTQRRLIKYPF